MKEEDAWVAKDLIGLRPRSCLWTTQSFRSGLLDEAATTARNERTSTSGVVRKVIFAEGGMVGSDKELKDGLNTTQAATDKCIHFTAM